jgi:hypothetical protein
MRLGLRRVRPALDAAQLATPATAAAASAVDGSPPASEASAPASDAVDEPTRSLAKLARAGSRPAASLAPRAPAPSAARSDEPAADKPKKRGWLGFMRRSAPEQADPDAPTCCKSRIVAAGSPLPRTPAANQH